MKKLLNLCITGASLSLIAGSTIAAGLSGLVAHYPLNGNAQDVANNNHGTIYGATPTAGRQNFSGQAYRFNGTTDYIEIQDDASLDVDQVTMAVWIKREGGCPSEDDSCMIFNKEHSYELAIRNGNTLQWAIWRPNIGWAWYNTGITIPQDRWTHVALTFDGHNVKAYVNNQLGYTLPYDGTIAHSNLFARIGGRGGSGNGTHSTFNGAIDEVCIYNRALTNAEINEVFSGTCAGLLLAELESFKATAVSNNGIHLKWKTLNERDNLGFFIVRAKESENEEYTEIKLITKQLIPTKGDSTKGARYSYKDTDVVLGDTYFYLLVDIDQNGNITPHWDFIDSTTAK